jgi:uncharacterized MAPEG superfamily protein
MLTITAYHPTLWLMTAIAGLLLLQLLIADVSAMIAKHKPGHPIPTDNPTFLFRSARAHANTNETIAAFILLATVGILAQVSPGWLNGCAGVYMAGRVLHMVFYYAHQNLLRSTAFVVSLLGLIGMLGTVVRGLF